MCVKLLLRHGADVEAQESRLGDALQAALHEGHVKTARKLLQRAADINAQGGDFGHALYAASSQEQQKVVNVLLAKGRNSPRRPDHPHKL